MNITFEQVQEKVPVTILKLVGVLDASSFQDAITKAQELKQTGTHDLLLDLRELTFMSSSGIVALHSIALLMRGEQSRNPDDGWDVFHAVSNFIETARGFEAHCKILCPQQRVMKTLEVAGFTRIFEIFTDREHAIASFK